MKLEMNIWQFNIIILALMLIAITLPDTIEGIYGITYATLCYNTFLLHSIWKQKFGR